MQNIKLLSVIVFSIVLTACSIASASDGPFVKYPLPPQSKILVVSAVNDNFIYQRGFSTNYSHLNGGNLDGIILQSVAQTLRSKQYQVVTTPWANSQLFDVDTEGSMIRRSFQSITTGSNMPLNPEVFTQLHYLNARYHADYILLITGNGRLFRPAIGNWGISSSLDIRMYLIDARNNNMIASTSNSGPWPNQYSVDDNLQQWLRTQAPQLASKTTQELFLVASFR